MNPRKPLAQRSATRHARASFSLSAWVVGFFVALLPSLARAQHCHVGSQDPAARGFELSLRGETARFRTARYEGHYEGLFVRGAWAARDFSVAAAMPRYDIVRNGLSASGFGDLLLEGRGALISTHDQRASAGALLALSAPTGDSKHDLGMGHWMIAPSAWGSLTRDRFTLEARLGYARAFGGSGHHQHAPGTTPIVDPMNESEFEASLSAMAHAHQNLHTRIAVFGAAPTPSSAGEARGAASFAFDLLMGQGRLSVEAQLPLLGDAFTGKLAAELGFRF
jgi:hypothetical protein